MTYMDSPTFDVQTSLGPVRLVFTNGGHMFAHTEAHNNDDKPTIAYRGKDYLVSVHLYRDEDWLPRAGEFTSITARGTNVAASKTAHKAIVDALREAVLAHLVAHPETLRKAEYVDAKNDADGERATVDRLAKELAEARTVLGRAMIRENKARMNL